jgi:hypothetical protein
MAQTSAMWWPWVQRQLNARDWRPADLAREIRKLGGGPDESVIGRWKNKGATPTRESVIAVAKAFHCDRDGVRRALIAAGLVTAREFDAPWADPMKVDLTTVPDEALAKEVVARLVRRAARQPAANGPSRTTIATTDPGGTRHTVPAETTTAPPSSGEDERAGTNVEHCA